MHIADIFTKLSIVCATASAAALPQPHEFVLRAADNNGTNSSSSATTCELGGPGQVSRRDMFGVETVSDMVLPDISPRAPDPDIVPLYSKAHFGNSQRKFLEFLQAVEGDNDIAIVPPPIQLETWKAGHGSGKFPIGATSDWFRFSSSRYQRFKMRGLSGCTGSFLISPSGMWASHLWESTRPQTINGGSAFLKRISATSVQERSSSDFKECALDILDENTPSSEINNRDWKSLADMRNRYGNPLSPSSNVRGLIFTKAKSGSDSSQKYRSKISALKAEYLDILQNARIQTPVTYIGSKDLYPSSFPSTLKGVVGMQYSPCVRKQGGRCVARFELYCEYAQSPNLVHEWISG